MFLFTIRSEWAKTCDIIWANFKWCSKVAHNSHSTFINLMCVVHKSHKHVYTMLQLEFAIVALVAKASVVVWTWLISRSCGRHWSRCSFFLGQNVSKETFITFLTVAVFFVELANWKSILDISVEKWAFFVVVSAVTHLPVNADLLLDLCLIWFYRSWSVNIQQPLNTIKLQGFVFLLRLTFILIVLPSVLLVVHLIHSLPFIWEITVIICTLATNLTSLVVIILIIWPLIVMTIHFFNFNQ